MRFSTNNLLILQGRVISKPLLMVTSNRKKLLKFLVKIPNELLTSQSLIPGSYETISAYSIGSRAELFYERVHKGKDVIVLGRLMNIRSRQKIYTDLGIDSIIRTLIQKESLYLKAAPEKRIKIKEKIFSKFPNKVFPGQPRDEILILNLRKIQLLNNYRNVIELTGNVFRKHIRTYKNRISFDMKIKRDQLLFDKNLITDHSKFDIVNVSCKILEAESVLNFGFDQIKIKVIGRLFKKTRLVAEYDKKRIQKLVNDFKNVRNNDSAGFKRIMNDIKKFEKTPVMNYSLKVKAKHLIIISGTFKCDMVEPSNCEKERPIVIARE